MDPMKPVYFDLDTVNLLRETLEEAWASIPPRRIGSVRLAQ